MSDADCDAIPGGEPGFIGFDQLNHVNGRPGIGAVIKQQYSDFQVDEELGFAASGAGGHLLVQLRKVDVSTTDVARQLASVTGNRLEEIGYSGMKDRRGQCSQWFSVPFAGDVEQALSELKAKGIELLHSQRNHRKLRIGSHKSNHFRLLLRRCRGSREAFEERLAAISRRGVPNYFGAQRFGRDMSNLGQVVRLFETGKEHGGQGGGKRHRRGMLFSAARAYLFNQVVSERLAQGNWNQHVEGDVLNLDGTDRYFPVAAGAWDETLGQRLDRFDIHISGPLAGTRNNKDRYTSRTEAADIEESVLQRFPVLVAGLRDFGLKAARRPLRFAVADLEWAWDETGDLQLRFTLPKGAYATSLLRELCTTDN